LKNKFILFNPKVNVLFNKKRLVLSRLGPLQTITAFFPKYLFFQDSILRRDLQDSGFRSQSKREKISLNAKKYGLIVADSIKSWESEFIIYSLQ
jgi:hypothetical protein